MKNLELLPSEEDNQNRYFLAFRLAAINNNNNELNELVTKLNKCLKNFKLPNYFKVKMFIRNQHKN